MRLTAAIIVALSLLIPIVVAQDTDGDGFDDDIDHRDDEDAHLILSLEGWEANTSAQWDANEGDPDPYFRVCVEADSNAVDCFDSPKWENTLSLGPVWNLTVNIPDDSSLIRFIIECYDDDFANDDECDMNDDPEEWRGDFIFSWLDTSEQEYILTGIGDNHSQNTDVNATWIVISPTTDVDSDGDGVDDDSDAFPNDPSQWSDGDGDGYGDNLTGNNPDVFPQDPNEWSDSDGDGYGDNGDMFPQDETQWADRDGDGFGDNRNGQNPDSCPDSPITQVNEVGCADAELSDSDGDGIIDSEDKCSNSLANESVDTEGCSSAQINSNDEDSSSLGLIAAILGITAGVLGILGFIIQMRGERKK